MKLLNIVTFIISHPLSKRNRFKNFIRFIKWQIGSRLVPGTVAVDFVNDSRILAQRGLTGATGNVYVGLHEFNDMAFVLHLLRKPDLFVDIGANIGSYTILAGAAVGAKCLSYEPIPETFQWLIDNINLNGIYDNVQAKNIGIGRNKSTLDFICNQDTTNHVVSSGEHEDLNKMTVNVESLDVVIDDQKPLLIKIDVEGFETEIIAGADKTLRMDSLLGVIMELNGSGERYGYNEEKLHLKMLNYGFRPFQYSPFDRKLRPLNDKNITSGNTIYLRNLEKVEERLNTAAPFKILGQTI